MNLPIKDSLDIFFKESLLYMLIFAVYALLFCGIVALIESRFQQSEIEAGKIVVINSAYFLLAVLLVTIKMYINGWASRLFGSEFFTSLISLFISLILLVGFKIILINYLGLSLEWLWVVTIVSTLILLMPYIAFIAYVFMLASADWRH